MTQYLAINNELLTSKTMTCNLWSDIPKTIPYAREWKLYMVVFKFD
jgi:hypothetical protein